MHTRHEARPLITSILLVLLTAGSAPGAIAQRLPADALRMLDIAILPETTASDVELAVINEGTVQITVSDSPPSGDFVTATADMTEPVITTPETSASVATTDTAGTATTTPETSEPVTTAPDATGTVTTTPETSEPVTTAPDATGTVTTTPETSEPVATAPDTTEPATTAPGATEPAPVTTGTAPGNHAPVIGGTPVTTVTAGTAYGFRPSASDIDGDTLRFSIQGIPGWAGFDTMTGRLSGTPDSSAVGTYSNIRIAVTDGIDTVSLPAFSITVDPAPQSPSSFTLQWTAPVARTDGTPLTLSEIGGYRIHYGTTPGSYPGTVDVTDASATSATLTDLPAGTYYVVMTSYDSNGLEGPRSAEVVKTAR